MKLPGKVKNEMVKSMVQFPNPLDRKICDE